ncbi:hypothetical protein K373_01513 [Streptomyces sp. DvalAA-21]|nr:hypothetical protein K373_01513 [Streptomyces sp. DvalAA-21]RAJ37703.1 hypothetical protein K351_01260 [Streptomyces sp. DpondAA-E10]RAJ51551.1 hypothetical protein K352_00656 [Streptomyces sp. DpondAA-A50]SCD46009.1 hypothetical protein GA0115235_102710 [Streptomyces sp. DpondAA-F4a]SCL94698.1 hypothetical protein SAMN04883147_104051 [Streptomyces sp. DpondAA-F4]
MERAMGLRTADGARVAVGPWVVGSASPMP